MGVTKEAFVDIAEAATIEMVPTIKSTTKCTILAQQILNNDNQGMQ